MVSRQSQLQALKADITKGLTTAKKLPEFRQQVTDLQGRLANLKAILPELPLVVVSEFAPGEGEWIRYHVKRTWRENRALVRWTSQDGPHRLDHRRGRRDGDLQLRRNPVREQLLQREHRIAAGDRSAEAGLPRAVRGHGPDRVARDLRQGHRPGNPLTGRADAGQGVEAAARVGRRQPVFEGRRRSDLSRRNDRLRVCDRPRRSRSCSPVRAAREGGEEHHDCASRYSPSAAHRSLPRLFPPWRNAPGAACRARRSSF